MSVSKRLSGVLASAERISIDDTDKIAILSDCHRGMGTASDNFAKNQNIYFHALQEYEKHGYHYIELGDGDELWENVQFSSIVALHDHVFWLLRKFYEEKRVHFIFGNHDRIKEDSNFRKKHMRQYFCEKERKYFPLFPDVTVHEGLVLQYKNKEILLVHGHQGDILNDVCWRLAKFLVRYVWKPLELFGVNDPTEPAKNDKKRNQAEKEMQKWAKRHRCMLIAGHTHRPVFPQVGQIPYFNDGSCVHPRCITAIEIVCGKIALVKWQVLVKDDGTLYINKEILAGENDLTDFFVY